MHKRINRKCVAYIGTRGTSITRHLSFFLINSFIYSLLDCILTRFIPYLIEVHGLFCGRTVKSDEKNIRKYDVI